MLYSSGIACFKGLGFNPAPVVAANPNRLGSAKDYSVYGATVTVAGLSSANKKVGGAGAGISGVQIGSSQDFGTPSATQCAADILASYNALWALPQGGRIYLGAARQPDAVFAGDMAGLTFWPGCFFAGAAITNSSELILDARGDANAEWIFLIGAAFAPAAASLVTFVGGIGSPANVYWAVTGATAVAAGGRMVGNIIGPAAIGFGAAATLQGRALTNSGAITMSANTITTV
jgi:hypothetical protein